jgi:glyoxylase-like metal-dependent hydrolase (beta-lactamase superfamily II)|tara:strand:+ start:305 stop:1150 length:846 start_codon:yes stop_codon:yes gene_type:complete
MKLNAINTGFFKLDGGAMFGVVPKSLWQRTNPADQNNLCTWAMRSMLIEDNNRLILIDTGIGSKQDEKFFSHYHLHGNDSLKGNLKKIGHEPKDITDVFLTHLHFDHVGGAVERIGDILKPTFENANYWTNQRHLAWAKFPNNREKASFLVENIRPLEESGQLNFIDAPEGERRIKTGLGFDAFVVNGHTDAQMCPIISYRGETVVFMADLLPSVGHIPLPYVMGYDTRPLITLEEKSHILNEVSENGYRLFLEHDPQNETCTLEKTDRGPRLAHTRILND